MLRLKGEMDAKSMADFQESNKKLNTVYWSIERSLDSKSKKELRDSQRAWLRYRDAEAKFEANVFAQGGTVAPVIYNECRASVSDARVKELHEAVKAWTESGSKR